MTIVTAPATPPRKILAAGTLGGFTHLAPILEICRILSTRGHIIEVACLEGQQHLAKPHEFVSKVHVIGHAMTAEEDERIHKLFDDGDFRNFSGRKKNVEGMKFFDQWWPECYRSLDMICRNERPDFIIGDFFADCVVDMLRVHQIPIAVHCPQTPFSLVPQKWIPGMPGFQLKHITSEHASIWDRINEEWFLCKFIFSLIPFVIEKRKLRSAEGVQPAKPIKKPDYLVLINSCFGLEVPKDLPPFIMPIGPVLADHYTSLGDSEINRFLQLHNKTVFIAFGTHIELPDWRIKRIMTAINMSLEAGHITGVVWALKARRGQLPNPPVGRNDKMDYAGILRNQDSRWLVVPWVPQRAILEHPSTRLFVTHCGGASVAESAFHGVPMIGMPVFGDQNGNSMRMVEAGVMLRIDRWTFTAEELRDKIGTILEDKAGSFQRNCLRIRRIVTVNSRRKFIAADKIEEVLYDHELRYEHSPHNSEWMPKDKANAEFQGVGKALKPPHLETADLRMPWWKANNYDLYLAVVGSFVVFPIILLRFAAPLLSTLWSRW